MKLYHLIILALFSGSVSYAQIYKWTDASGIVHFSDVPHAGAETVNLPKVQTQTPSTSRQKPSNSAPEQSSGQGAEPAENYEQVSIVDPQNQATIRNNQGMVPVSISLQPPLMKGHKLQLIFDGRVMGAPQSDIAFMLNGVERGSHTISVNVLDEQGKVAASTETVTIFMHRPRVGMVRGGGG